MLPFPINMCYNQLMKVHELSFYSQFHCTMENCPDTCCHGWQIILDRETVRKYRTRKDLTGLRLRSALTRQNGTVLFKNSKGKCPFLTKDRLCGIQLSLGESYLPDVCRIFPRHRISYGFFAEELLFLSCPQASRLFLDNLDHLHFETAEREAACVYSGTNDDPDYLQELLEIRFALTARIMDAQQPRPMLYAGLLSFAKALQQSYISNTCADPFACLDQADKPFAIPHDVTYAMLDSGFYHIFLKMTSPLLYDLCRSYFKKRKRAASAENDAQLIALQEKLHFHHPEADRILRGYLAYYLLEDFLMTYEDYSFLRNIATGIMHTHLLELFFALYDDKYHRLSDDDVIQIITVYTRRGRHNDTIEKDMYEKLKCFLYSS